MMGPRRLLPITAILSLVLILILFHRAGVEDSVKETWRDSHAAAKKMTTSVAQKVGMGDWDWPPSQRPEAASNGTSPSRPIGLAADWKDKLVPGVPDPWRNYTRVLVVPRIKTENVSWMDEELPDIEKVVYVADDPSAPLHPPANKGHEAIVYLTYIIDNYDSLPDIMLFMHAHRKTWHNNDALGSDSAEIVRRLNPHRVIRDGYMNLRCHWYPGCPDWMHPGNMDFDIQKTEQVLIAKAWVEIFPFDPVPDLLAQPCCSQFALSRERVLSIPKAQFEFYRNWILNTKLKDFISGRVWEYMWQYAFTGRNYWCPVEHLCYCDGYGVCFGGEKNYNEWIELKKVRDKFNLKLLRWQQAQGKIDELTKEGKVEEAAALEQPEPGKDAEWWGEIQGAQKEMDIRSSAALERGKDPKARAEEPGLA